MFITLREYIINIKEILYIELYKKANGINLIIIVLKNKYTIELYKLEGQSNNDLKVEFDDIFNIVRNGGVFKND